jgi:hypothetical protein
MAAVQRMRDKAYTASNFKSGPQQTVTTASDNIVTAPTNGQTVYVPQYSAQGVYTQAQPTTEVTQPSSTIVTSMALRPAS